MSQGSFLMFSKFWNFSGFHNIPGSQLLSDIQTFLTSDTNNILLVQTYKRSSQVSNITLNSGLLWQFYPSMVCRVFPVYNKPSITNSSCSVPCYVVSISVSDRSSYSSLLTISLSSICRRDYLLKGSQNFDTENLLCNLKIQTIPTFSLLHHFWHCPFLSSNMSLSMFWLLRRWLVTILQRIFEKLLSCQSLFQIVLAEQLLWQC